MTAKYSFDDILEALGGYKYFSYDTIYYVYYKVNGMEEGAQECYERIQIENQKIMEIANKLKTENELKDVANADKNNMDS